MRLEFVGEGAKDAPLVLIAGKDAKGLRSLHAAFQQLASSPDLEIRAASLPGFDSGPTELVLTNVGKHEGLTRRAADSFRWVLGRSHWEDVAALMKPFLQPRTTDGFQYLEEARPIGVILSTDGLW